jgi:nitroreductase
MDVIEAMETRKSIRAYLDRDVPKSDIEKILNAAARAPSGVNTQPWKVAVIRGQTKQHITDALIQARHDKVEPNPDYSYYPDEWKDPYRMRRIICGKALYSALGIEKGDRTAQMQAWENNYRFFGAPVAILFFIDKALNKGSWLDMGMFIENVMLAAVGQGLATCPQASVADYPDIVRDLLAIDHRFAMICGVCLGYADPDQPVNQYRLSREPQESFTTWYD